MHPKNIAIANYNYTLPDERIAKYPLPKKDEAKLLVYNNTNTSDDYYYNLGQYIPSGACLFFNQTSVINARLLFQKASGGKIELFCLEPDSQYKDIQNALEQTQQVYWKCLVGGASKWKDGSVITLAQPHPEITLTAQIVTKLADAFLILFKWQPNNLHFAAILASIGELPIPPYLNRPTEIADNQNYQTIFAQEAGSVAAPTAALHFTESLLQKLKAKSIDINYITLHVGAGTFKPVKSSTMDEHDMHPEYLAIELTTIQKIITHKINCPELPIIAVGTTAVRTLESLYWIGLQLHNNNTVPFKEIAVPQWLPYENSSKPISPIAALKALENYFIAHNLTKLYTRTQIIIAPGYQFHIVDQIITNFHQPQSTLLLLIAAYIGDDWKDMYTHALDNKYRFLSYGDGCFLKRDTKN